MLVPTIRKGWKLQFDGRDASGNSFYADEAFAKTQADRYRPAIGVNVTIIPATQEIPPREQAQSAFTVIRVVLGDEFTDQLMEIFERTIAQAVDDAVGTERGVQAV